MRGCGVWMWVDRAEGVSSVGDIEPVAMSHRRSVEGRVRIEAEEHGTMTTQRQDAEHARGIAYRDHCDECRAEEPAQPLDDQNEQSGDERGESDREPPRCYSCGQPVEGWDSRSDRGEPSHGAAECPVAR